MRSTFCVLFYLKRKDVRKDGTVPVMGRITIDGGKPPDFVIVSPKNSHRTGMLFSDAVS